MIRRLRVAALAAILGAAPLTAQDAMPEAVQLFGPETAGRWITLRTTTDIAILEPTVTAFLDTRPDLAITYEQWGSNDLFALTAADCAAGAPTADIVISSGVHQMVKLVNDRCAAPWISPETLALAPDLRWRNEVWGVSREPAVMVYNRDLVPAAERPATRFDLLDLLRPEGSRYAGRVATYDIEASGLGFLFAYMDALEATTFGALMEAFARSGAVATCCSAEIIAGVAAGEFLIAYNVLGSYAAEAAQDNPGLGIVAPEDYTLILSRAAILPGAAADPDAAGFLDFILSPAGQARMAAKNLVTAPGGGLDDDDTAPDSTRQRPIPLGPSLLVALDGMKSERFLIRWRQAFAP
ncbi:MAG: ABC transporter substrate-binding protein [Maritimibacter sp.]|nr:ABC transporter substrate-binding protein [Maritimibacter sp.]